MPSVKIHTELKDEIYFLTFTIKNWYYIFDRHNRFKILAQSIQYCQKHKGLKLFAYVFMLNHLHLIASAPDMIVFVRDFKKFVSKKIQKNIIVFEPNILPLFEIEKGKYEFWQKTNMPKMIESATFFQQKMDYIIDNPVRKGYVEKPEYWIWSSANPHSIITVDEFET